MSATRQRISSTRPVGMARPAGGVIDTSALRPLPATNKYIASTHSLAPIAIQRWEAEGGALDPIRHA